MRGVQDLGLPAVGIGQGAANRGQLSAALPSIVAYVKSRGYPGARQVGDDAIDFGDGYGPIDVLTAQGQWWWGPAAATTSAPTAPAAPTGATTFGGANQGADTAAALVNLLVGRVGGTQPATAPLTPTMAPGNEALRTQILAGLQQLITEGQQGIGDVSRNPEALAYSRATQRESARARSQALERRAAQGLLGSGAAETDILGIQQQSTEAQAQFEATLAHNLLNERRDRLERALTTGAGYLSQEQQFQLQSQLAQTNASLSLLQALFQNQQFYDTLGLQYFQEQNRQNQASVGAAGGR
jgi:hypothetical protein